MTWCTCSLKEYNAAKAALKDFKERVLDDRIREYTRKRSEKMLMAATLGEYQSFAV